MNGLAHPQTSWRRSARTWVGLGIVVPVGMVAVCSAMLLQLRWDAWDKAEQTSKNLIQVIERDIDRNIEIIDVALQNVVDNLKAYDLEAMSPNRRQSFLFDRAVNAKDLNALLVLDQYGNSIYDAASWPPRRYNNADRPYFRPIRPIRISGWGQRTDHVAFGGKACSHPEPADRDARRLLRGRGAGQPVVDLLRSALPRPPTRPAGTINLFLNDGTRILRYPQPDSGPPPNFSDAPNFQRFLREGRGRFVAMTHSDGIERLYTFTRVGNLPLILNVALSTEEIEAEWRAKALVIG